ncbi:HEPN domain-containing protein [Dyadobacter diqingensis]|uniref:HEPN domain-containing protein n=1 Tax=Dyadobacter diqingensis TaxID=2938121 RepID=UPI0020C198FF|nr:HEPN domain-containing protein [Dyadobacter diqingensis]
MLSLDPNKVKFLNQESVKLLNLVEEVSSKKGQGSSEHQTENSLDSKIEVIVPTIVTPIGPLMEYTEDTITNTITSAFELNGERKYGLGKDSIRGVYKMVENILKENSFKKYVSKSFLVKKTLQWIFSAYQKKQIDEEYSNFILSESTQELKDHKILFFVDKIEISGIYHLGKSTLFYMNKAYIDKLEIQYKSEKRDEIQSDPSYFATIRKLYQGKVFVSTIVRAEREKAVENALKECSISIDILKICSPTLNFPEYPILFDIDKNAKRSYNHEFLQQDIVKPYSFNITGQRDQRFYTLNPDTWQNSLLNQIEIFHNFLIQRGSNEISSLIEISITRFADALSKENLHQRIIEIFTVLESLLLKDETSSIIESVTKYCSKLVTKHMDERTEIIELLKKMYKVRSSLIHHGLNKDFDIEDLKKIQIVVIILLTVLIAKSTEHSSKQSILQEIDDAIMNAY